MLFTSLAVRNGLLRQSFFTEGFSYDVTTGVRKRFIICEDSWDARCSVAFSRGCIRFSFSNSLLFSLLLRYSYLRPFLLGLSDSRI
jgi:hypothetical protein